jgi:energy-coupling factor transporter ATP-binding protein EcfA2
MAHAARGRPLPRLAAMTGVPVAVRCETDEAVDDLAIVLSGDARLLVQSKASLDFRGRKRSPLAAAVKQVTTQLANGLGPLDHLVIATDKASGPIHDLRRALDRRRDALSGALSNPEQEALAKFEILLADVAPSDRRLLFDRLSILIVSVSEEGSGDAGVAAELLDAQVVASGTGRAAFRALRERFRERAVLRSGLELSDALRLLVEDNFQLSEDATGSPAERLTAERSSLVRYRADAVDRASTIDLRVLGVAARTIEPLPLIQTMLTPIGVEDDTPVETPSALRRRGRMLLSGAPGSGKSTLLRQLFADALEHEQPAVLASLRRLVDVGFEGDPLEQLALVAFEDSPAQESPLLTVWLKRTAANGELLICLDALDETRDRRFDAVQWIDRLMKRLQPDCELVVATRASAYAAAQTLRLPEVHLGEFRSASALQERVLDALVPSDTKDDQRRQWVQERMDRLRGFEQTATTPLVAVVLAVLAADDATGVENGKARVLNRLVERVARSWERRPGRAVPISAGLGDNETTAALLDAFDELGAALVASGAPRISAIEVAIASMLVVRWGLASGPSEVAARECVHFWDEAGFFTISGDGTRLSATVAQFAELGAARLLVREEPGGARIAQLARQETYLEVINLACGLDTRTAGATVEAARTASRVDWLSTVGEGLAEGPIAESDLTDLVAFLTSVARVSDEEVADVARLLVSVPVPLMQRSSVMDWLETHVDLETLPIFEALAQWRWQESGWHEALRQILWLEAPHADEHRNRIYVRSDPAFRAYLEAIELAIRDLDPNDSDAIERAGELAGAGSARLAQQLEMLALRKGIVLRPDEQQKRLRFAQQWATSDPVGGDPLNRSFPQFLEMVGNLSTGADLSRGERRRLDELARLLRVLQFNDSPYVAIPTALRDVPSDLKDLLMLICALSDLDVPRLAAEAQSALEESSVPRDRLFLISALSDMPGAVRINRWDTDTSAKIESAVRLLGSTEWIATIARRLLLSAPDELRPLVTSRLADRPEALLAWKHLAAIHMVAEPAGTRVAQEQDSRRDAIVARTSDP